MARDQDTEWQSHRLAQKCCRLHPSGNVSSVALAQEVGGLFGE